MAADDYAVIVGIAAYPGLKRPLQGPENDARAFREWVVSPTGGNIPNDDEHVHLICSSDYPAGAFPENAHPWTGDVYSALESLRRLANDRSGRAGRRLYMFFAGHGITPENEVDEAALLMANAAKGSLSHVPGREVAKHFRARGDFDQVVLLMDCCRDAWGNTRLQGPDHWDVLNRGRRVEHFFGFASQWNQKARETTFELTSGKPQIHGVFTAHLITMLRSGRMTATTLRKLILNSKQRFAVPQTLYDPSLEPAEQDTIVLAENAPAPTFPVLIRFNTLRPGEELEVRNGTFEPVYRGTPVGSEVTIPLAPSHYEARILGTGTRREFPFNVPGEETIDL